MDENQMKLRGDGIEQGKQKQIKWDMDEKSKHFKFQVGQSSFGLFHNILWKNPDELFGHLNTKEQVRYSSSCMAGETQCGVCPSSFPSSSCLFSSFSCNGFLNSLNLFSLLSQQLSGEIFLPFLICDSKQY